MDSGHPLLIPLDASGQWDDQLVGGKAAKLAQLMRAGFEVPRGFCLTTRAYEAFVKECRNYRGHPHGTWPQVAGRNALGRNLGCRPADSGDISLPAAVRLAA